MAFLNQEYDVATLPEGTNYELLPAGWYNCTIDGAELKDTKEKTGQFIAIKYKVTGPTHDGRVVFCNLNIKNSSSKAEEIGRQQLGELMRAIGLAKVTDTDQLIGGNLQIKLAIRDAANGYDASNEVRGYKSIEGGSLPMMESKPTAKPAAAPWAKK